MRKGSGLKIAGGGVIGVLLFLIVIIVMIISVIAAPMGAIVGGIGGSNSSGTDVDSSIISLSGFVMPISPGVIAPQFDTDHDGSLDTASDYMLADYKAHFGWDHNGIDIQSVPLLSAVRAVHKGVVADVSYGCGNTLGQPWAKQCPASTDGSHNPILAGGGNYVLIEVTEIDNTSGVVPEGKKLFAVLCHMENEVNYRLNKGDVVEAGQRLGTPGNSGNSAGVHGHFMLLLGDDYKNAKPINPGGVAKGWPGYQYLVMYKNER